MGITIDANTLRIRRMGIVTFTVLVTLGVIASRVEGQLIDGYTPWTPWGACSVSCAGGAQSRFRDCIEIPVCGGGRVVQGRNCNNVPCPIHGGWELWESWISCTKLCGGGITARKRSCDAPSPSFGGRFCEGGVTEHIDRDSVEWAFKICNNHTCTVNGGWDEWTAWSICSATCSGGTATRARTCTAPEPAGGGEVCIGSPTGTKQCNQYIECPVHGGWEPWSLWSYCSTPCVGGVATSQRTCTNPFPLFGGTECVGNTTKTQPCNELVICPVNGEWAQWGIWTQCSSSCFGGQKTRKRTCSDPPPSHGGFVCQIGEPKETASCNGLVKCAVDGMWAVWGQWSSCSSTCAGGLRTRDRICSNPSPSFGGQACAGLPTYTEDCNQHTGCPLDGGWRIWTLWTACSADCGGGQQTRERSCIAPAARNGGAPCGGPAADSGNCNTHACP